MKTKWLRQALGNRERKKWCVRRTLRKYWEPSDDIPTIAWEKGFEDVVDTKGRKEPFEHGSKILRAKIPGGWIVRALEISKGTVGFVLFQDPEYTWERK